MIDGIADALISGSIDALRKRSLAQQAKAIEGSSLIDDRTRLLMAFTPEARLAQTIAIDLEIIATELEAGGLS